jgi:catechol 2,3-dioxygenase-like lactoylglutathione lyase family enzyme
MEKLGDLRCAEVPRLGWLGHRALRSCRSSPSGDDPTPVGGECHRAFYIGWANLLEPPSDPTRASAFLNLRVADLQAAYQEWSSRGAEFLTPPKVHSREIRCYMRDPDGHLIEIGQTTGVPASG